MPKREGERLFDFSQYKDPLGRYIRDENGIIGSKKDVPGKVSRLEKSFEVHRDNSRIADEQGSLQVRLFGHSTRASDALQDIDVGTQAKDTRGSHLAKNKHLLALYDL